MSVSGCCCSWLLLLNSICCWREICSNDEMLEVAYCSGTQESKTDKRLGLPQIAALILYCACYTEMDFQYLMQKILIRHAGGPGLGPGPGTVAPHFSANNLAFIHLHNGKTEAVNPTRK